MEKLNEDEFSLMLQLIQRYSKTELDQWNQWKFDSKFGKVFFSISRSSDNKDSFEDVTHMIKKLKA